MAQRRSHTITPCSTGSTGSTENCVSFGAGHNTHTVQATLAGRAPRGWALAVVEEINDRCVVVSYADRAQAVVVWHHRPLDLELRPGSTVRLHTQQALLEVGTHWLSVAVSEPFEPGAAHTRLVTCTES